MTGFVSYEEICGFTGYKRPKAQRRFLLERGIICHFRADGSVALRQDEYDAHTLSKSARPKKESKFTANWDAQRPVVKRPPKRLAG